MFTEFLPRHDMRAIELEHHKLAPLPLHVATLVTNEIGDPSFRGNHFAAWYADAVIVNNGETAVIPVAVRIDMQGNASITCPFNSEGVISMAIASLATPITVEPRFEPEQKRAYRR